MLQMISENQKMKLKRKKVDYQCSHCSRGKNAQFLEGINGENLIQSSQFF